MHILFLTHYFPPEGNAPARRTFEHAIEWVKKGHKVTVITNHPNHPEGKLFPGYTNHLKSLETMDGIAVVRVWTYLTPNKRFVKRVLNFLIFSVLAFKAGKHIKDVDLLIGTSPQFFCAIAAKRLAKRLKKPFILEVRDLWPESIKAVKAMKNNVLIRYLEKKESELYNQADSIVINSLGFKNHIEKRLNSPTHIDYIPNGIHLQLWKDRLKPENQSKIPEQLQLPGSHVAYVGTLGMAHGLTLILDVAEKIKDEGIYVHLIGSGSEKQRLESLIVQRKLDNVFVHGFISNTLIPSVLEQIDVVLVSLLKTALFDTVIPSKLYEAMAAKKPVVAAVGDVAARLVDEANCGICVERENAEAMTAAILKIARDLPLAEQLGKNGHEHLKKKYSREGLADDYIQLFNDALKAS